MGVPPRDRPTLTIPPQILIQMMYGEAGGQSNLSQDSVAAVARNRFGVNFVCNSTTWQGVLGCPNQFQGVVNASSIVTGVEPELDNASIVFSGQNIPNVGGSDVRCYISPTLNDWNIIKNAYSGNATSINPLSVNLCWDNVGTQVVNTQIIWKQSIEGNVSNGPAYQGAPAFVFERLKANPSTDPAVVVIQ